MTELDLATCERAGCAERIARDVVAGRTPHEDDLAKFRDLEALVARLVDAFVEEVWPCPPRT